MLKSYGKAQLWGKTNSARLQPERSCSVGRPLLRANSSVLRRELQLRSARWKSTEELWEETRCRREVRHQKPLRRKQPVECELAF
jgi:hypothetical protein